VGQDAVAPAVEAHVLDLIADLGERCETRSDVEVNMAQIAVLRHVEAGGDPGGVPGADLEVDVAHRRVEGDRAGIGDVVTGRHAAGRRERHAGVARGGGGPGGGPVGD